MKRYNLGAYTLTDHKKGQEYTTGVSLADCTIPFEDLLNKQDNYINYYTQKYRETQKKLEKSLEENTELKETIRKLEEIIECEFDMNIKEFLENMEKD